MMITLLCTARVRLFVCQSVCVYVSVFVCALILCVGNVKSRRLQDSIFGLQSRLSIVEDFCWFS